MRNGPFADELRSPRVLDLNVLEVRLGLKPLCGLTHRKNCSFQKQSLVIQKYIFLDDYELWDC